MSDRNLFLRGGTDGWSPGEVWHWPGLVSVRFAVDDHPTNAGTVVCRSACLQHPSLARVVRDRRVTHHAPHPPTNTQISLAALYRGARGAHLTPRHRGSRLGPAPPPHAAAISRRQVGPAVRQLASAPARARDHRRPPTAIARGHEAPHADRRRSQPPPRHETGPSKRAAATKHNHPTARRRIRRSRSSRDRAHWPPPPRTPIRRDPRNRRARFRMQN